MEQYLSSILRSGRGRRRRRARQAQQRRRQRRRRRRARRARSVVHALSTLGFVDHSMQPFRITCSSPRHSFAAHGLWMACTLRLARSWKRQVFGSDFLIKDAMQSTITSLDTQERTFHLSCVWCLVPLQGGFSDAYTPSSKP